MAEHDKLIDVIQDLVETCRDSQEGYRQATQIVEDPELRSFFSDQSLERGLFVQELEERLSQLGRPGHKPQTSASGSLRRVWVDLKKIVGAGDESILSSVEAGEAATRASYEKALQQGLPEGIQQTLHAQLESIVEALDHLRLMRERRKAA